MRLPRIRPERPQTAATILFKGADVAEVAACGGGALRKLTRSQWRDGSLPCFRSRELSLPLLSAGRPLRFIPKIKLSVSSFTTGESPDFRTCRLSMERGYPDCPSNRVRRTVGWFVDSATASNCQNHPIPHPKNP